MRILNFALILSLMTFIHFKAEAVEDDLIQVCNESEEIAPTFRKPKDLLKCIRSGASKNVIKACKKSNRIIPTFAKTDDLLECISSNASAETIEACKDSGDIGPPTFRNSKELLKCIKSGARKDVIRVCKKVGFRNSNEILDCIINGDEFNANNSGRQNVKPGSYDNSNKKLNSASTKSE